MGAEEQKHETFSFEKAKLLVVRHVLSVNGQVPKASVRKWYSVIENSVAPTVYPPITRDAVLDLARFATTLNINAILDSGKEEIVVYPERGRRTIYKSTMDAARQILRQFMKVHPELSPGPDPEQWRDVLDNKLAYSLKFARFPRWAFNTLAEEACILVCEARAANEPEEARQFEKVRPLIEEWKREKPESIPNPPTIDGWIDLMEAEYFFDQISQMTLFPRYLFRKLAHEIVSDLTGVPHPYSHRFWILPAWQPPKDVDEAEAELQKELESGEGLAPAAGTTSVMSPSKSAPASPQVPIGGIPVKPKVPEYLTNPELRRKTAEKDKVDARTLPKNASELTPLSREQIDADRTFHSSSPVVVPVDITEPNCGRFRNTDVASLPRGFQTEVLAAALMPGVSLLACVERGSQKTFISMEALKHFAYKRRRAERKQKTGVAAASPISDVYKSDPDEFRGSMTWLVCPTIDAVKRHFDELTLQTDLKIWREVDDTEADEVKASAENEDPQRLPNDDRVTTSSQSLHATPESGIEKTSTSTTTEDSQAVTEPSSSSLTVSNASSPNEPAPTAATLPDDPPPLVHTVPRPAHHEQTVDAMRRAELCIVTAKSLASNGDRKFLDQFERDDGCFPRVSLVVFDDCHQILTDPDYAQVMNRLIASGRSPFDTKVLGITADPPQERCQRTALECAYGVEARLVVAENELIAIEEVAPHPKEYVVRYNIEKAEKEPASGQLPVVDLHGESVELDALSKSLSQTLADLGPLSACLLSRHLRSLLEERIHAAESSPDKERVSASIVSIDALFCSDFVESDAEDAVDEKSQATLTSGTVSVDSLRSFAEWLRLVEDAVTRSQKDPLNDVHSLTLPRSLSKTTAITPRLRAFIRLMRRYYQQLPRLKAVVHTRDRVTAWVLSNILQSMPGTRDAECVHADGHQIHGLFETCWFLNDDKERENFKVKGPHVFTTSSPLSSIDLFSCQLVVELDAPKTAHDYLISRKTVINPEGHYVSLFDAQSEACSEQAVVDLVSSHARSSAAANGEREFPNLDDNCELASERKLIRVVCEPGDAMYEVTDTGARPFVSNTVAVLGMFCYKYGYAKPTYRVQRSSENGYRGVIRFDRRFPLFQRWDCILRGDFQPRKNLTRTNVAFLALRELKRRGYLADEWFALKFEHIRREQAVIKKMLDKIARNRFEREQQNLDLDLERPYRMHFAKEFRGQWRLKTEIRKKVKIDEDLLDDEDNSSSSDDERPPSSPSKATSSSSKDDTASSLADDEEEVKYFNLNLYAIKILAKERKYRDKDRKKFALLVSSEIKDPPVFPLYLDTNEVEKAPERYIAKAKLKRVGGRHKIKLQDFALLKKFHQMIFTRLVKTEPLPFSEPLDPRRRMFLVVPLNDKGKDIDWDLVVETAGNDRERCVPIAEDRSTYLVEEGAFDNMTDASNFLLRTQYHENLYRGIKVHGDMSPLSPFPTMKNRPTFKNYADYLFKKYNVEIMDNTQPLISVYSWRPRATSVVCSAKEILTAVPRLSYLVPECCDLLQYPANCLEPLQPIPSIIWMLESRLNIRHLHSMIGPDLDLQMFTRAMISSVADPDYNYERLEFIGDTVLKFLCGAYLYLEFLDISESELTRYRSDRVSNANLFNKAVEKERPAQLASFVIARPFLRRKWVPQTFAESPQPLWVQMIPRKMIADVVESLTGVCFKSGGGENFERVQRWLEWIGIPLRWKEGYREQPFLAELESNAADVDELQETLGYQFNDVRYLYLALSDHSMGEKASNKRLSFLGDAVTDMVVTQYLWRKYPDFTPGRLTKMRSDIVRNDSLAIISVRRNFHRYMNHKSPEVKRQIDVFAEEVRRVGLEELYAELKRNCNRWHQFLKRYNIEARQRRFAEEEAESDDQEEGWDKDYREVERNAVDTMSGADRMSWTDFATERFETVDIAKDKYPKIFSDVFESLIGAVFLDCGRDLHKVWAVFEPMLEPVISANAFAKRAAEEEAAEAADEGDQDESTSSHFAGGYRHRGGHRGRYRGGHRGRHRGGHRGRRSYHKKAAAARPAASSATSAASDAKQKEPSGGSIFAPPPVSYV